MPHPVLSPHTRPQRFVSAALLPGPVPLLLTALCLLLPALLPPVFAQSGAPGSSGSAVNPILYPGYITSFSYLSPFEDEAGEFTALPSTLGREGAAYGDEGEEFAYLVGGVVNLHGSAGSPQALGDVWLVNITSDTFVSCGSLPTSSGSTGTLYYGQGEWNEANEQLIIYGGVQSAATAAAEAYFANIYTLQFVPPVSCTGLTISVTTINPPQPGRKYHSIEIIDGVLYVFGGYNAVTPLTQSQLFFTVNLATGVSTTLNTNSPYFPVGIIEPAVLEDEGEHILFFYSGLSAPPGTPGSVFPTPGLLARYDWERNEWLNPITAVLGSSSLNLLQYPQFVFSCHTHTLDDEHWFFAGGQDGSNNSLETIVHFDMSTDSTVGVPTVTVLYAELPELGLEHCAMALGTGGELIVYTGYSEGVDSSPSLPYPRGMYESVLPFLSPTLVPDTYSSLITPEDATAEWAMSALPPPREGAAFGSDGSSVYFAGGAVLSAETVLAFTDVWALNAPADVYVSYATTLPGPSYFGTGQWYSSALWIWGGRTNTMGSGVLNTYNANLYKVDFSRSPAAASTVSLSGALVSTLVGTQHASSVVLSGRMYVWGGTNGATGTSTPPSSQQWFSIALATGAVTQESSACVPSACDYPSTVWVNPVLFTSSAGRYIYLYSGLQQDYATWNNPFDVFVYDTVGRLWLEDVEPYVSPFSALTPQFPNMAFGAVTVSSDGNHVIVVGGTWGDTSPNGAGSHTRIFHIDATPMLSNGSNGRPILSILHSTLPTPTESAVAGLTQNNGEIILFSGAQYWNSELSYPVSYSSQLLEVQQAGFETHTASSSTVTCSGSGSSLSGGQVAGIVVGSIFGTAIIVGLIVYFALSGFPKGKEFGSGSYRSHSDSEMSSRA